MRKTLATITAALCVCLSQASMGETWYVNGSAPESGNGQSWETAFTQIQEGIDASSDADTVIVAAGTYQEHIHFPGKNIRLTSTDPLAPTVVAETAIVVKKGGPVVTFIGGEGESCVLSGFTIRGGSALCGGGICGGTWDRHTHAIVQNNVITKNSAESGAGIAFCDGLIANNTVSENTGKGSLPSGGGVFLCNGTIRNNTITGNSVSGDFACGGGIAYCDNMIEENAISGNSATGSGANGGGLGRCHGLIQDNVISGNSTEGDGGGVFDCDFTIQNNTISDNLSNRWGGGLAECGGTIENNTISGNSALFGGGLATCHDTIQNNIISRNSADAGGGLLLCGATVQNNLICGNSGGDVGGGLYSCNGTLQNNVISGNTAIWGAGLALCHPVIQNNTIVVNSALWYGGGLGECEGTIRNCIIWGNRPTGSGGQLHQSSIPSFCCVKGWAGGTVGRNISEDPRFVNPEGPDREPETYEDNDYRLSPDSPCIDAGNNDALGLPETDIAGNRRIVYGGRGKTATVDIGAYEYYINEIGVDGEGTVTLTWSSLSARAYSVYCSSDVMTWECAAEYLPSDGDTVTRWVDATAPLQPGEVRRRYYRVKENQKGVGALSDLSPFLNRQ